MPRLLIPCFALFALAGCGPRTSVVTGTVTYHGKPLVLGSVVLVDDTTQTIAGQATIQPDGSYRLTDVPFGVFKVAVHSRDPSPRPEIERPIPGNLKKMPLQPITRPAVPHSDKWFPIPERYQDWNQSGLAVTIDGPTTSYDIPLTD